MNVSRTRVVRVKEVRILRRRILEMPNIKAAWEALTRLMSVLYVPIACRLLCSIMVRLNRLRIRNNTKKAIAMIAKANRIINGWAILKAGCTCEIRIQITNSRNPNPPICQRMSGNANNNRSPKKAAGITKAKKKISPLITSFWVLRTSGYARDSTPNAARVFAMKSSHLRSAWASSARWSRAFARSCKCAVRWL